MRFQGHEERLADCWSYFWFKPLRLHWLMTASFVLYSTAKTRYRYSGFVNVFMFSLHKYQAVFDFLTFYCMHLNTELMTDYT